MSEETPTATPPDPEVVRAREETLHRATEIAVRLGVLAIIAFFCLKIVAPFIAIVAWALIIAIGAAGPYEYLARAVGGRRGLAATLCVLVGLAVMIAPAVLLSESLVSGAQHFAKDVSDGAMEIPPPPASVAEWPVVGQPLFELWSLAYENLTAALTRFSPQLRAVSTWFLHAAGAVGAGLLQLIVSLLLAGVLMSRGRDRTDAIEKLAIRLAGRTRGPEFARLTQATISSVVQGIVGVALVQSILAGLAFIVADIPAAGLWAMGVLVAAIVQLPVVLVMIPPILLAFSTHSVAVAVAFTIWCVAVTLVDNVLKPILFGRGVKLPTLVIFIGSIGGMLAMGIIGLFIGAVVLGVGYELFNAWIAEDDVATSEAGH
ncbi:MAG: AI-2E family transporter [bacterium]|nr:AI-2E family transporter [bacterium]